LLASSLAGRVAVGYLADRLTKKNIMTVFYVTIGAWVTHRYLLVGLGRKWLFQDVGIPLGVSLSVELVGVYVIHGAGYPAHIKLAYGVVLALVALLLTLAGSPQLRMAVWNYLGSERKTS